jgi:hypothetical protein
VKVLFLFVDGIGLREAAPDNPVAPAVCPTLHRLVTAQAVPLDACLGVPGFPQSATGQTALFTGVNAARHLGRHMEGFPGPSLRNLIANGNLLLDLVRRGRRVRFANAYLAESVEEIRARRFKSVTTVAGLTCPEVFCLRRDLLANAAVFHDITRATMRERGYTGPLVAPEEAAGHLIRIAQDHDFTLFEFFLTDLAGHSRDRGEAVRTLALLDRLLDPLCRQAAACGLLLVLASDHGNIECMEGHNHSRNPVPLAASGPGAEALLNGAAAITDVTPRLLELLA